MYIFFSFKTINLARFSLFAVIFFVASQTVFGQKSIIVDFSVKPEKKESIVGFLHFNDLMALDKNIKILKPKYWRVGNTLHDKNKRLEQIKLLHSYKITPILVLTDFFAGTDDQWEKPFLKKEKFKNLVKDLYLENGNTVVYDIWNEPNTPSWGGTREQFLETFKDAHDAIRSLPGGSSAIITGPGLSRFEQDFLQDFLKYCAKNKLKVDILNWHEGGIIDDVLEVQKNIKTAQGWIDTYSSIGIKKIYIPEILWHTEQFNPAAVLAYLAIIEKNGATGACKTCWDTPPADGGNTCYNNSMDGILDPKGNTRSVWWAYKFYAESLDKRVSSKSTDEFLANLAYINSSSGLSILFTNASKIDIEKLSLTFKSIQKGILNRTGNYKLKLHEVTNTQEKSLSSPRFLYEKKIRFKKEIEEVILEKIEHNKMYVISIQKIK